MTNNGNNLEVRIQSLLNVPSTFRTRTLRPVYLRWAHKRIAQLRALQNSARRRRNVKKPNSPHRRVHGTTASSSRRTPQGRLNISNHPSNVSGSNNIRRRIQLENVPNIQTLFNLVHMYYESRKRRRVST
jgi:hypothetical protein